MVKCALSDTMSTDMQALSLTDENYIWFSRKFNLVGSWSQQLLLILYLFLFLIFSCKLFAVN